MKGDAENSRFPTDDFSRAMERLRAGDPGAWDEIMPLVYAELHGVASREMGKQASNHTLQPTALINEVFVKLRAGSGMPPRERNEFIGLCAQAMRSILTDHARAKLAKKRKIPGKAVPVNEVLDIAIEEQWRHSQISVLELDDLLNVYRQLDHDGSRLVELRYFAGRTVREAAEILDISERHASRLWEAARVWLKRELSR